MYVCLLELFLERDLSHFSARILFILQENFRNGNWGHGSNADSKNFTKFNALFESEIDKIDFLYLADETYFVHAIGPDGQRRIHFTDKTDPIQNQQYAWPRPPYVQILLKQAFEFNKRLESSPGLTQTALAEELGMSRVQITQILGLLRLAPEIQKQILGFSSTDTKRPIPKHSLMRLSGNTDHRAQLKEFKRLLEVPATITR